MTLPGLAAEKKKKKKDVPMGRWLNEGGGVGREPVPAAATG